MADKNKNGIPDELEKRQRQPQGIFARTEKQSANAKNGPVYGQGGTNPVIEPSVANGFRTAPKTGAAAGMQAGAMSSGAPVKRDPRKGMGLGLGARIGAIGTQIQPYQQEQEMSFADYLAQAMGMMGGAGGSSQSSGGGSVNYDPQRNTARQNAGEADARLEAMYRQLRGSIDADAPVLQQTYGDARAATDRATQTAQAQTQAATNSANTRNDEVLANLGIQQAQGNQIIEGRDLDSQTAEAVASQATTGQAANTRLASNEASALAHNTNIGNAAGLEGNLQRAAVQSQLAELLSKIDMQEQQDNASLASQASSTSSGADFGQLLQVANAMYGFDSDKQDRQDKLQMSAAELAQRQGEQESKVQYDPNKFNAWLAEAVGMDTLPTDPYKRAQAINYYRQVYTGR